MNSALGVFGQTECVQKRASRTAKDVETISNVKSELQGSTWRRETRDCVEEGVGLRSSEPGDTDENSETDFSSQQERTFNTEDAQGPEGCSTTLKEFPQISTLKHYEIHL